jgi:hypothetical protein
MSRPYISYSTKVVATKKKRIKMQRNNNHPIVVVHNNAERLQRIQNQPQLNHAALPINVWLTATEMLASAKRYYEDDNGAAVQRVMHNYPAIHVVINCKFRQAQQRYNPHHYNARHNEHHAIYQYQAYTSTLWNPQITLNTASTLALRYYRYCSVTCIPNYFVGCERFFNQHGSMGYKRLRAWKVNMAAYIIYRLAKGFESGFERPCLIDYKHSTDEDEQRFFYCFVLPTALTMTIMMDNETTQNLTMEKILYANLPNFSKSLHKAIAEDGIWSYTWITQSLATNGMLHQNNGVTQAEGHRITKGVEFNVYHIYAMITPRLKTPPANKQWVLREEKNLLLQGRDELVYYRVASRTY